MTLLGEAGSTKQMDQTGRYGRRPAVWSLQRCQYPTGPCVMWDLRGVNGRKSCPGVPKLLAWGLFIFSGFFLAFIHPSFQVVFFMSFPFFFFFFSSSFFRQQSWLRSFVSVLWSVVNSSSFCLAVHRGSLRHTWIRLLECKTYHRSFLVAS